MPVLDGQGDVLAGMVGSDPEAEMAFEQMYALFRRYRERIQELSSENEQLKSAHFENAEIKRLQEEVESLRAESIRSFTIDEAEAAQIRNWIRQHELERHEGDDDSQRTGAIGGNYTYSFIPTSIGVLGKIKCGLCGAELVFQDM